jgi:hypothetical protein
MARDAAELSSLHSAVMDAARRIEGIAAAYEGTEREDLLGALYEAERNLRAAVRQIERAERLA